MVFRNATIGAAIALVFSLAAPMAAAQNTSGVSSPTIEPGDFSAGYRLAVAPPQDGRGAAFAHRFHVQRAITDDLRLRLLGALHHRDHGPLDFSSVGAEARWHAIKSAEQGWDGGLIFQVAVPASPGNPDRFKLGLPAQIDLTERWRAQAVFYTGFEIGDNARDGALLEFRTETTYEILDGLRFGPQLFSDFNTTGQTGPWDEQRHQIGFVVKGEIANRLGYETGALFGLSDAASDVELRLFFSYGF